MGPTQHPKCHPGRSPPGGSGAGEELESTAGHPAAAGARPALAKVCLEGPGSWWGSRWIKVRVVREPELMTMREEQGDALLFVPQTEAVREKINGFDPVEKKKLLYGGKDDT